MSSSSQSTPETLREYPEYARRVIDSNPQMNESNTKHKLVDPLLRILGWEMALDVELEYSIQMGQTTKHVDYSLQHDGGPEVFVEAKGCDSDLTEGDMNQLESYLKQQNVDWGLLTNGREFEIVRRRFSGDDIVVDLIGTIALDNLEERTALLETLSKKSIESGRSARFAKTLQELRSARDGLRDQKDEVAERIVEIVANEVGETVTQRAETHAKEFVDALVADIEQGLNRDSLEPDEDEQPDETFWTRLEAQTAIARDGDDITFPDGQSATASFSSFVTYLWEEGYLGEDDLPLQFGRKRFLLHRKPVHSDGDDMYEPRKVADGVYLETHASVDQLKRNSKKIAKYCEVWD